MTLRVQRRWPWLSIALLTVSYFTFGWFLHAQGVAVWAWGLAVIFAIAQSGLWTIFWDNSQRFILNRTQSDLSYVVTVLILASLAVAAIAWIHVFIYIVVMVMAALFVRLDTVVLKFSCWQAFYLLLMIAAIGLGSSWFLGRTT